VTVVNVLAHAEAWYKQRLVQTMGQRARRERLVYTRAGLTRSAAGRPGGARRTQARQPAPPLSNVRGHRRPRTRRGLLAPTSYRYL